MFIPDGAAGILSLSQRRRYALYEDVALRWREEGNGGRSAYFALSRRPMNSLAENEMELLSDVVSQGELYLHNFEQGVYCCARCGNRLYDSDSKWRGPCVWPSFRKPCSKEDAISLNPVPGYNGYT